MGPLRWAVCVSLLLMSSPRLFAVASDPCLAYGALLRDAIRLLPEEHRFPCDAQHLVIVRGVKKFTLSLPDSDRAEVARKLRQRWVWAFVLRRKFPIYVLQTGEQGRIAERYALGQAPWLRFFMSCVLVHEQSHIVYQLDDGAAYRKELECINAFKSSNHIPRELVTTDLEKAIQTEETTRQEIVDSSDKQPNPTPARKESFHTN